MDMRIYYNKIRQTEQTITADWPIVMSLETPEGGKADVPSEVSRRNAARLIVEGRARIATPDETKEYRASVQQAKRAYDDATAAKNVQVTLVSTAELQNLKGGSRPSKG